MGRKKPQISADGWQNVLTGLGDYLRDKREYTNPVADLISYDGLTTLYRGADLAQRIVDLPVEEALRQGWELKISDLDGVADALQGKLADLQTDPALFQAVQWQRLYGGGAILIGANDGQTDLSLPLNESALKSIDFLTVFDPWECRVEEFNENPASKDFGKPLFYSIMPQTLGAGISLLNKIHSSRILQFKGPTVSRRLLRGTGTNGMGWGDSVLQPAVRLLRDFDAAWGGIGNLLQDFKQDVFKLNGLASAMLADKDSIVLKRIKSIDMARSMVRAMLLDGENESFERHSVSVAGLSDVLDRFAKRLAAAARMPVSVLFGENPAGLNATGASDIRIWYDSVRVIQERDLRPALERLVRLCMIAANMPEPDNWTLVFKPLWQSPEVEKAAIRLQMAQTDQIYLQNRVLTVEEIRASRFGADGYSVETELLEAGVTDPIDDTPES